MRVLLDTNVLIDVLARREPFYAESKRVVELAATDKIMAFVGAGSIADIYYIVRKNYHSPEAARRLISDLVMIVHPVDTAAKDVINALSSDLADFEDAIVAETAKREEMDYIVTRNGDDFMDTAIKALTPHQFIMLDIV